jgi:hypothetical protein
VNRKQKRFPDASRSGNRRMITTSRDFQKARQRGALGVRLRETIASFQGIVTTIRAKEEIGPTPAINDGTPSADFAIDLDYALRAIGPLFQSEHLPMEEVTRDEEGLVLFFPLKAERFAVHLCATRRDPEREDLEPAPALLANVCRQYKAIPLQLRVNLTTRDDRTISHCFGEEAFRKALHMPQGRWTRHLLGGVPAKEWLARAGRLSTLGIREVKGRWPYARIDGRQVVLPKDQHWCIDNPPLHPGELCRSVNTDDSCSLFTCECSEPLCGGIECGVLVAHEDGLVVWRSPERPTVPLAVFSRRQYRKVVLAAMKNLLKDLPKHSGLNWAMATSATRLHGALDAAKAGKSWF